MRLALVATTALAVIVWSPSSNAAPCAGFIDVDTSSSFCTNVVWIKNRNITLGCTATLYCPNDPVTRLQMAAFLNRLGNVVFQQGGNAFGATAVLGTTDNQPLDVRAGNVRVMRLDRFSNVIAGDPGNSVSAGVSSATIAGGGDGGTGGINSVTGTYGVVGGGRANTAGFLATISGGQLNQALGLGAWIGAGRSNVASGQDSAVPGGSDNLASGDVSLAFGSKASANGTHCVVFSLWGYLAPGDPGMPCFGIDQIFLIGATNGFAIDYFGKRADGGGTRWLTIGRFGQTIATWNGAVLTDGGAWTNASDANSKEAFEDIDRSAILDKVAMLPVRSWRYKADPQGVRRIGPTAQDFRAAFGLGADDKTIATVDADGVALVAIQGLNAKLESRLAERDAVIAEQQATIRALIDRLNAIEARAVEPMAAGSATQASATR